MKKERRELNEKCRTQLYDAIVRNKCSEELLKELEMQEKNGNDGLSQYNINLIKSYPKEEDKVRQLLHFSTTSGDSVFDSFIQAITHTNKPELIEILYSELPPDQQTGNEKSTPAASASAPASSPLEHSFGQAASSFQDANIKRDSGYYSCSETSKDKNSSDIIIHGPVHEGNVTPLLQHIFPNETEHVQQIVEVLEICGLHIYKTTSRLKRVSHAAKTSQLGKLALNSSYDEKENKELRMDQNLEKINELLRNESNKYSEPVTGRTPLHYAVCSSKVSLYIVKLLLEHGFNPLTQTKYSKRSVLHYASVSGNSELVKILLEKVEDKKMVFNCRDRLQRNPLHYVSQGPCNQQSEEIVQMLMENNKNWPVAKDIYHASALLLAVNKDNSKVVHKLLSYDTFKENINEPDIDGKTPLYFANDYPDIKKLLIDNGAAPTTSQ